MRRKKAVPAWERRFEQAQARKEARFYKIIAETWDLIASAEKLNANERKEQREAHRLFKENDRILKRKRQKRTRR